MSVRLHWAEYLIEAWALGIFMISAGSFTVLFEAPASPVHAAIPNGDLRRLLIGLTMGLTAIALIYSRWGQRSGAHMNPAVTLTFWWLGRMRGSDAIAYMLAQLLGGLIGVLLFASVAGDAFRRPPVQYVVTLPGRFGVLPAFVGELLISCGLMYVILLFAARPRLAPFTGLIAGALVAAFIAVEAPLSGMSMNPARSFASACSSGIWTDLWLYFVAPPLGMLLAAVIRRGIAGRQSLPCAKLQHPENMRCIHCGLDPGRSPSAVPLPGEGLQR